MKKMTFGQNSVGLKSTDDSNDPQNKFKQTLADAIDQMHEIRITSENMYVISSASTTINKVLSTYNLSKETFRMIERSPES